MGLLSTKSFLKSKTIIGIAITAAAPYAPAVLAAAGVKNAPELVTAVMGLGGAMLGVYGRIKAVKALV